MCYHEVGSDAGLGNGKLNSEQRVWRWHDQLVRATRAYDWPVWCCCKTWLIGFCWAGVGWSNENRTSKRRFASTYALSVHIWYSHDMCALFISLCFLFRSDLPIHIHARLVPKPTLVYQPMCPPSRRLYASYAFAGMERTFGILIWWTWAEGLGTPHWRFALTHKQNIKHPLPPTMSTDTFSLQPGHFKQVSRFTESFQHHLKITRFIFEQVQQNPHLTELRTEPHMRFYLEPVHQSGSEEFAFEQHLLLAWYCNTPCNYSAWVLQNPL